jgi:hypothetical protein
MEWRRKTWWLSIQNGQEQTEKYQKNVWAQHRDAVNLFAKKKNPLV